MRKSKLGLLLLAVISLFVISFPLQASQTGYISPSEENGDFENPENAFYDDQSYATILAGMVDQYHNYGGYGMTLPTTSTIEGIKVRLDAEKIPPAGNKSTISVRLSWDGGDNWTESKQVRLNAASIKSYYLGGSTDNWGHNWSASELNRENFSVKLEPAFKSGKDSPACGLYWVPVQIYYSSSDSKISAPGDVSLAVDRGDTTETSTLDLVYAEQFPGNGQITVSASIGFGNPVNGTVLNIKGGDLGSYNTLFSGGGPGNTLVLKDNVSGNGSVNDIQLQLDATGVSPGATNLGQSWEYELTYTLTSP